MKEKEYCRQIFLEACEFANAASSYYDKLINDSIYVHYFVVAIVNMSFALELFLKSITYYKIDNPVFKNKGHSIKRLIEMLPPKDKKDFLNKIQHMIGSQEEYESNIKEIDDAFKKWRYVYEENSLLLIDITFLDNCVEIIAEIALNYFDN